MCSFASPVSNTRLDVKSRDGMGATIRLASGETAIAEWGRHIPNLRMDKSIKEKLDTMFLTHKCLV